MIPCELRVGPLAASTVLLIPVSTSQALVESPCRVVDDQ